MANTAVRFVALVNSIPSIYKYRPKSTIGMAYEMINWRQNEQRRNSIHAKKIMNMRWKHGRKVLQLDWRGWTRTPYVQIYTLYASYV